MPANKLALQEPELDSSFWAFAPSTTNPMLIDALERRTNEKLAALHERDAACLRAFKWQQRCATYLIVGFACGAIAAVMFLFVIGGLY